jgi:serine/threonine-protein kinase
MERLQQIEEIFQEALQRDSAERDAYVRQACRGDSELQREVSSLLANHRDDTDEPWAAAAAAQLIDTPGTIRPGQSLGPYQIESFLAAGGMGEVYRATDTRLNRQVAIKVSSGRFSERFQREARVIASLNHPNICQLYDVGPNYLVMELVEGPTLAERIRQGTLPVDEALATARQIAEALEAAHEKGRVHRDLKPANVKITPEGLVKLLDFGLAKAAEEPAATGNLSDSPTQTMSATRAGVVLGTAAYMSPEQAKGKPVDRRADIWAFGVVLYEMLTGRQMYSGETVSETLAAVIKDTPDLTALPEATPLEVRRMLRRCLEKDPHHRLQAIGEARCTLELPREGEEQPGVGLSAPRRTVVPWLLSAVLGLMVVASAALLWRATRPVLHPLMRFSADLGPGAVAGELFTAAISPDGNRIVYPVREGDTTRLATRLLDQSKSMVLAGTEDAEAPFFSPNGQWIGFFAANTMKKIPVQGGGVVTLCKNVSTARGASWGEDGYIIANLDVVHLYRVPAAGGGTPQIVAKPEDKGQINYRFPQILPGGENVLVSAGAPGAFEDGSIAVLSLKTGDLKIIERGYFARYLPSGHLIYMHQGKLFGVRFNAKTLETYGMRSMILDDVADEPGPGSAQLDFSQTGTLLYLSGRSGSRPHELVWMEASGKKTRLLTTTGHISHPRVSPDGKRVALVLDRDISVSDPQQPFFKRITWTTGNQSPVWTPDGRHIVYAAQPGGIWWTRADGSTQPQQILETKVPVMPGSFSPDGSLLAYSDAQGIWILHLDTADPDHPKRVRLEFFVTQTAAAASPAFSPDGQFLAYGSGLHIYVQPYPAGLAGGHWQVSDVPGRFPIWRKTGGRQLFYETTNGQIMAVDYVVRDNTFIPLKPRPWSEKRIFPTGPPKNLDVTPDGQRFVVFPLKEGAEAEEPKSLHVTFLLNFGDYLRRTIP